jgi:phosphohistidine phosphatase
VSGLTEAAPQSDARKGLGLKRLLLLRHAKSAWDNAELPDAARPLSKRGKRTAPLIGQFIAKEGFTPDLILSSSAKRATQTMKRVREAFGEQAKHATLDELYMATPREILTTICDQAGDANTVLVIGHNPGLGDLAAWMVSDGDTADMRRLKEKFPTAALAVIDLPIDHWRDVDDTATNNWNGRLARFVTPRDLAIGEQEDE